MQTHHSVEAIQVTRSWIQRCRSGIVAVDELDSSFHELLKYSKMFGVERCTTYAFAGGLWILTLNLSPPVSLKRLAVYPGRRVDF